jgi:hypothetical protein
MVMAMRVNFKIKLMWNCKTSKNCKVSIILTIASINYTIKTQIITDSSNSHKILENKTGDHRM